MTDYFTDGTHFLISAPTGSRTKYGGKTSLATWWCDVHGRAGFDQVLFFNPKIDETPEEHADAVASDYKELGTALANGHQFVCFSPLTEDWEEESRRFKSFMMNLNQNTDRMVVLDEAAQLDQDVVQWFVRVAGNGWNCKTLVLSQKPNSVEGRDCMALIWIGPTDENCRHVFTKNNRGNHFQNMLEEHEPYTWSVLLGPADEDRDFYKPVPEEYA
jgi:hypothetical protein